ncbi:acyl-CoA/acyl-ACP dehydrogenase [Pseudomonas sp. S5(2021)]|uniref:acyl-CoA dehydrogenase family protein n=1 Tax=Stutzerimonas balearica TaxID=74829 RepID=UPI001BCA4957|nr:acyl-CoA dehydrogenase family protein [Stutzerimonas balearica]MBS4152078.1 acyl-CoA dehydrogenase [Stutzerimonas balearica]MBZ5754411.1 acyl-CoA/acyl-ACP dehydrogenase [Pseudomonas sp. S5(2021)]
MDHLLPVQLAELQKIATSLAESRIAPRAAEVDAECRWPAHAMQALAEAGLLGLQVPGELGGLGQGLLGLCVITEAIGRACPSSALCFGMHCVATAVIAAKATEHQREHYLRDIAAGRHITTLALSEQGTGAHFYLPETRLRAEADSFVVDGTKQFVTSGGHADSYVVSTVAAGGEAGDFSCLVVDRDSPGMHWLDAWNGFGMRGNSSRPLRLEQVRVPAQNLLGEPGDQVWYVFEVVAPFFLIAMAGTYLGVAQAALDEAELHLRQRRYSHSGEALLDVEALQVRYGELWTALVKSRALVREAARRGDGAHPEALPFILAAKADAAETAVRLTNEAMTLCGGAAYRANSRVARLLRDARAAHVMTPTTDLLKLWTGRSLLGLPLL